MQLTSNHISPPGALAIRSAMASQSSSGRGDGDAAYVENFMSLFPEQVLPGDQAVAHDPLAQCLPGQDMAPAAPMVPAHLDNTAILDETVAPSVITHTASPAVTPSATACTFSHASEYNSKPTQPPPPLSQLQPMAQLPATSQTFALPRPFQPSTANKKRHMPRIAPANLHPSSQLFFTGLLFLIFGSKY